MYAVDIKSLEVNMSMSLKPLGNRVVIEPNEQEEITSGGIVLPETAKEKPQKGKIIAAGKGKVTEDGKVLTLDVKVGDLILFGKYSGTEIKVDGKEYLMMREDDVLGVIEK